MLGCSVSVLLRLGNKRERERERGLVNLPVSFNAQSSVEKTTRYMHVCMYVCIIVNLYVCMYHCKFVCMYVCMYHCIIVNLYVSL